MRKEVMDTVDRELGAIARPGAVHFVTLLPKTRSGKLLRRSIQALAEGRDPGDLTTIEDPAALEQIRARRCAAARRGATAASASRDDRHGAIADVRLATPTSPHCPPPRRSGARRVTRGDAVDSVHYGSVAVVDRDGRLIYAAGDPAAS